MRRTHVVAVSALIAASALIALTGPAQSRQPGRDALLDADAFVAVAPVAAVDGSAMTTSSLDDAHASDATLGQDDPLGELGSRPVVRERPAIDQPASPTGVVHKNLWRWDPDVSWYGPGFYGKRTACGHAYTESILGVAHRTLPCGTRVSFRNPANGRTITVPVIDRGPYVAGRQWDLSGAACLALGHCYTGPIEWKYAG